MDKCKVEIDTINPGRRHAAIKPKGFWSRDMISVFQSDGYGESVWEAPQISWGSGGRDNTLSSIESAKSFISGLQKAVEIATAWDADTGKKSR